MPRMIFFSCKALASFVTGSMLVRDFVLVARPSPAVFFVAFPLQTDGGFHAVILPRAKSQFHLFADF
jgi:hypothetical protein